MKTTLRRAFFGWLFILALASPALAERPDSDRFFGDRPDFLKLTIYRPNDGPHGTIYVVDLNRPFGGFYSFQLPVKFATIIESSSRRVIFASSDGHTHGIPERAFDFIERATSKQAARAIPEVLPAAAISIPVSNDGDSFAMTADEHYAVVVGANILNPNLALPVSLVDLVAGSEVSTLAIAGGDGRSVDLCDDGETVLATVGTAVHRIMLSAGTLVDTGDAFALPAEFASILRIRAVPGSKVGLALALSAVTGPPKLLTFSIPGMQLLDAAPLEAIGDLDGIAVSPDGTKAYARCGYPVGLIDGFTLDPVTGALGHTPFLSVSDVSPAHLQSIFSDAIQVTPDGAHLVVSESAFPPTTAVPTPRVTLFDAVTGARGQFIESDTAPTLVDLGPPLPPPAVSTVLFKKGDAAPGAGAVGGPPADALLANFGVPAVDGDGKIAFTAKWTSTTAEKGSGLFTDTASVAIVGGAVPGMSGATFKSFADPLIDGGHVACLATLAGVPKGMSSAVLSDAPGGTLAVIGRTGAVAPGAGGAAFRKFEAVGLDGTSVGFLADLQASKATDVGLWAVDATHALTLLLREGQTIGAKMIQTLVSFKVGNGSPGHGRGWLLAPGAGTQALALVIFTDKSQAVVVAGIDGTVTVLSQSGPGGAGGPDVAGANFASYGVPALNAAGHSAFLGTLTVGAGGATKANARGVFADFGGAYTPTARMGDMAGTTGSTFDTFKDPVLASDDSLAFYATIKGGGVKGSQVKTLWAQAPDGMLSLAAQGGANATGTGGQWKDFTSLAVVAGHGPLFSATLMPGKGGVKATNATGVWGSDAAGAQHLFFRTGQSIDGKKLKSFKLLSATPGSLGATRSFNDAGQVAWLATFTDRTTAIISSEPPPVP